MYIRAGRTAHTTAKLISVVLWLFLLGHVLKHNYAQAARRQNILTDAELVALVHPRATTTATAFNDELMAAAATVPEFPHRCERKGSDARKDAHLKCFR